MMKYWEIPVTKGVKDLCTCIVFLLKYSRKKPEKVWVGGTRHALHPLEGCALSISPMAITASRVSMAFYRNESPTFKLMGNLKRIQRNKIISKKNRIGGPYQEATGTRSVWSGRMTDTQTSGMQPRRGARPAHAQGGIFYFAAKTTHWEKHSSTKNVGETRYPPHKKDQHWALISYHL